MILKLSNFSIVANLNPNFSITHDLHGLLKRLPQGGLTQGYSIRIVDKQQTSSTVPYFEFFWDEENLRQVLINDSGYTEDQAFSFFSDLEKDLFDFIFKMKKDSSSKYDEAVRELSSIVHKHIPKEFLGTQKTDKNYAKLFHGILHINKNSLPKFQFENDNIKFIFDKNVIFAQFKDARVVSVIRRGVERIKEIATLLQRDKNIIENLDTNGFIKYLARNSIDFKPLVSYNKKDYEKNLRPDADKVTMPFLKRKDFGFV